MACAVAGAGCAEGFDGLREGELFTAEAGDEAAATDFAAGFEAAEDAEEIAPFGDVGLAGEEVAEEDSVAVEEHPGGGLVGCVGAAGLFYGGGRVVARSRKAPTYPTMRLSERVGHPVPWLLRRGGTSGRRSCGWFVCRGLRWKWVCGGYPS